MPDGHASDERTPSNAGPAIEELRQRMLAISEEMEGVHARAEAEGRDLTEDERKFLDEKQVEFDRIDGDVGRIEAFNARVERLNKRLGRVSEPDPVGGPQNRGENAAAQPRRAVPAQPRAEDVAGKDGFRSFGEFARCVIAGSNKEFPRIDPRFNIRNTPTSWGNEGVGADGGFVVPPDFRQEIMVKIMGEDSLIGRTDQQISSGNTWSAPVDETTPWQTSGGIQAYWEAEGGQMTQSKPAFQNATLRLHKLTALVPITEELAEDAPSMDRYLRSKAPQKINYKLNDALINGTGAGQPLGIMKSPALVTVAAEASQAADTIRARNFTDMWARLYAPYRSGAVWLINQDLEAQLPLMGSLITTPDGTTAVGGAGTVYLPPGGLSGAQYATIFGRPVIATEACSAIGDLGDVILAALPQYLTVTKSGGIRTDVSMHLWFDYDLMAFKFVVRVAGQPWLSAPITRASGSNTLSSFVTLAAR